MAIGTQIERFASNIVVKSSSLFLLFIILLALFACGGPDGADGYNLAGVQHFEDGRLEEAVAAYSEAIRLDSSYTAAYYNRGQAYFTLGRPGLAVDDHTRAIELSTNDPQQPLAYAGRAMSYTLLSQDEEAQRDMAKAIELGFDPGLLIATINQLKKQR